MADSTLREALETAYDAQTSAPEPSPTPEAAPVADVTPKAAIASPEAPTPIGKPRDPTGKFVKVEGKTEAPKGEKVDAATTAPVQAKAGGEPVPATPPAEVAPKRKLPADMSAAARELAAKLPSEFAPLIDEWEKRHKETSRALSETAEARQFASRVKESLAPFETIARANGQDAITYAASVMQTATALQMGTQAQKDAIIATLIQTYGGNVEGINAHLSGQAAPVQAQRAPDIRSEFQKLWQEQIGQAKQQEASAKAQQFIATEPEFLQDVWQDMVEILRVAEGRGIDMDYQTAYNRACRVNDDVSKILMQRDAAKAATAQNAATQRSVDAASSIRSNPASAPAAQPKGLRAILEAKATELGIK